MRNFLLTECDVLAVIKDRYKVSPVGIEPWYNDVLFNFNATSSQNKAYYWRFDRLVSEVSPGSGLENPLFVGSVNIQVYNEDDQFTNVSGFFVTVNGYVLEKITTFYNLVADQWLAYGDGTTYDRPLLPVKNANESMDRLNNPHHIVSPSMMVSVYVNGTGALSASMRASFSGYRLWMS